MKLTIRKILAFMLTVAMLVSLVTINAIAETETTLISEGFEGGELPAGWTTESDSSNAWTVGTGDYDESTGAHSGEYNALIKHYTTDKSSYLVTPAIDLSGNTKLAKLSFWYINRAWFSDIDEFGVYYRVGEGEWQELFTTEDAHSDWTSEALALPAAANAAGVQLGFKMTDNYGYGVGLDDVELILVDAVSRTVSYDPNGGTGTMEPTTGYEGFTVQVAGNGFTPPEGMKFWKWNTQADGSGDDYKAGDYINLTGNITLYAQWADAASIFEDFETGEMPEGWTTETESSSLNWTVGTGDYYDSTGSHSGNYNAVYKSGNGNGYASWLITPVLDLSAKKSGSLSFWMINRAYSGYVDHFGVYYRIDGGEWVELFYTEAVHGNWTEIKLSLPGEIFAEGVEIGFLATDDFGYGVGLDDIALITSTKPMAEADMFIVTVPEGMLLNDGTDYAAQVSVAVKSEYEGLVGTPTFEIWKSGSKVTKAVNYGNYIVKVIVPESESYAAAVLTDPAWQFNIVCSEYFNNFDGEDPLDGWTLVDSDGDGQNWFVFTPSSDADLYCYSVPSVLTSASYSGSALEPDNWAILPPIYIKDGAKLTFWIRAQDINYPEDLVTVYIGDSTDINQMVQIGDEYPAPVDYEKVEIDLSAYKDTIKFIALRHSESYDLFRVNIDDLHVGTHEHGNYTYTAEDNIITAHCGNEGCYLPEGIDLILNAPPLDSYNYDEPYVATLSGYDAAIFPGEVVILYSGRDGTEYAESATPPTEVGDYTVTATVCGVTATLDYTIVNYTITVDDDIEGGTVTVEPDQVLYGDIITLTATPDPGYKFEKFLVYIGDNTSPNEFTDNPSNLYYNVAYDSFVSAVFSELPKPEFVGHSLVLSGQIGVKFGMDLSVLSEEEIAGSYMTFTVNGKKTVVNTADAVIEDGKYVFTCYVNSLQMAENIEAVFTYNESLTVSDNYSVADYIQYIYENPDEFSDETVALAGAIGDYGHYAQVYLTKLHNIPEGKYADMDMYITGGGFDPDELIAAVEDYKLDLNKGDSKVLSAQMKLSLDSETALSVRFRVDGDTELTASATFNGKTFNAVKQGEYYIIKITGITSAQLADTITITGDADGEFTVKVSVLAYVHSTMEVYAAHSFDADLDPVFAVASLYYYYLRTVEYRAAQ